VAELPVSTRDLVRWGETLAAVARTGLAFTKNLYEQERYAEILKVAGDVRAAAAAALANDGQPVASSDADDLVSEWMEDVRQGVAGYVTPKVAIGAIVGNNEGQILLVQRADSGAWLYPTGWADVGYSPAEVAVKEVLEETGIDVEPVRLVMVLDGLRLGFTQVPLYSLVFHMRPVGGTLKAHPLECSNVGWFSENSLPSPLANAGVWSEHAFAAIRGDSVEVLFDWPRWPIWRRGETEDASLVEAGSAAAERLGTLARMQANTVLVDRVSKMTEDLAEAVARLMPQLSSTSASPRRTDLEEIVASPSSMLLVARLAPSDKVVGMTTLVVYRIPSGLHAVIEDVVVDESARGHGVGAALVSEAVSLAREWGAVHVNLTSRSSREAANRLYARAGFQRRETNVYRLNLS
jgi:ADP-ribose pyrophosphatase YjhB (NUDIX family)/ribosomal protein S18 acetylase RimI-like enzyme